MGFNIISDWEVVCILSSFKGIFPVLHLENDVPIYFRYIINQEKYFEANIIGLILVLSTLMKNRMDLFNVQSHARVTKTHSYLTYSEGFQNGLGPLAEVIP